MLPHLDVAGEAGAPGLIPTTDRFGTALADIVRCATCGHMQLEQLPGEAELAESYGEAESTAYIEEEAGQRATARAILARIEAEAAAGRILDLGCWVGFFLDEAVRRGWTGLGVEPSEFASAYARERLGLEVLTAGLDAAELEPGSFDVVFMGDVIEHLPDPGAALDRVHALLTGDGVLALVLPDAGSRVARLMGRRWWSVIPTHVQYFSRASLTTLLRGHGFRPLAVESAPKAFTVGYYLGRIGGYRPALARRLTGLAAVAGVADRLWAPDFRDRMLLIARRSAK